MSITALRAPRETLSITQLSRQYGTTPRALRYYEEMGLLSPQRRKQARIYSHREQVRLQLILQARRTGFALKDIRELFEIYDKAGRDAQHLRALPLIKERLAALTQKRTEIADALETLKAASEQMAVRLGATCPEASGQSIGVGETVGRAGSSPPQSSAKRHRLREPVSLKQRQG